MQKVIAVLLTFTTILSVAACSDQSGTATTESLTSETVSETTAVTTADTTRTFNDEASGTTSVTAAPDYGDGQIADLCELMQSLTGKKVVYAVALVEEYFKQAFEKDYMGMETSYVEDPKGENLYHYYYYMKVTSGELSFNRFIFTANQEHGNVHTVEFVCSNSQHDNSLKPFDYTTEDLRSYYSMIEKELTNTFGDPDDSLLPKDNKPGSRSYSEYKSGKDITFRVDFYPGPGEDVSITCSNKAERKHYLLGYEAEQTTPETTSDIYFKEPEANDIVTDEKTGYTYVKNQLLISCNMGTPNDKEKIQKICEEIGAEIVGYIEITSDFQIEFKRDMTYDELMKIAKELEDNYYFIQSVTLNFASRVTTQD